MDTMELRFSNALVRLLQGVVVKGADPEVWNTIHGEQYRISEYVGKIGLTLEVDDDGGYAFLKQQDVEGLPHLVKRQPLTFRMSLFLALLRNEINEFDSANGDSTLVVSQEEMVAKMKPYFPDVSDEVKFADSIGRCCKKAVDMKILYPVKDNEYEFEVQPILRKFVDAEWLSEFNKEMEKYMAENGISVSNEE